MKELLSKDYAAVRRALIDPRKAIVGEAPAGKPRGSGSSYDAIVYAGPSGVPAEVGEAPEDTYGLTTYLAVVDKDRNMVSITSSLLSGFGSGMVVKNGRFFLNNRMAYFWLGPNDVNALKAGKRVRQTINPALALKS